LTSQSTADAIDRAGSDEDTTEFSGPRAKYGDPIPFIFGTLEQRSPICIWAGDVTQGNPFPNTQSYVLSTELSGGGTLIEGSEAKQFWSSLDLLLCERVLVDGAEHGFIRLRKIWYDGKVLWDGTGPAFTTPVTTSGDLLRSDPNGDNADPSDPKPGGSYPNNWWWGGVVKEGPPYQSGVDANGIGAGVLNGWWTKEHSGVWAQYLGLEKIFFRAGNGAEAPDEFIGFYEFGPDWNTAFEYVYPSYHKFARLSFNEFCWGDEPKIADVSVEVTVSCPAPAIGDDAGIMPNGLDVNPVSLLYTLLTHPDFCGGPKLPAVDTDSFSAARQVIYDEELGASYRLEKADKAGELVKQILDHIEGLLLIDPATGLLRLTLIRKASGVLPRFNQSHVLGSGLEELSKTTWAATASQCRVKFEMRNGSGDGEGADNVATAKDPGLSLDNGLVETIEREMPTIYESTVASKVAHRLLSEANTPRYKAVIPMNRERGDGGTGPSIIELAPSDVIAFDYSPLELTDLYLRIKKLSLGTLESNAVTVTTEQDLYQAEAVFAPPPQPDNYTVIPPPEEVTISTVALITAPYLIAKAGIAGDARKQLTTRISPRFKDGEANTGDEPRAVNYDRFFVMARRPYDGAASFEWSLRYGDSYGGAHVMTKAVPYTPCALADGDQTLLPFNSLDIKDMDPEVVGLIRDTIDLARDGSGVVYIAGNWFVVDSFTPDEEDPTKGTIGFTHPTLDTEVTQGAGIEVGDGAAIFFCDLSSQDWMLARCGPLLASNDVWRLRYSSLVGDEISAGQSPNHRWYQEPYGSGSSTPYERFVSTVRNIDSGKINLVTSANAALEDRANALLPPLRFQAVQVDPGDFTPLDDTDNFPVINVDEGATSFAIRLGPSTVDPDEYSIFNPRESDGSFVEPRVQTNERAADLSTNFAEFVQSESSDVDDRRANLEVWYTYPSASPEGDDLRYATVDASRNVVLECAGSGTTDSVTLYARQVLWGDRTEENNDSDVPVRASVPRIVTYPFNRAGFDPGNVPNWIYYFDLDHNVTITSSISVGSRFGSDLSLTYSGAGAGAFEATGINGRGAFLPPSVGAMVLSGSTASFTQAQPWTEVIVGRWYDNGITYGFILHSSNALGMYGEPTVGISQWAGTVRSHFTVAGAGYTDLPFVAIAVMDGASSYIRTRTHGKADATYSVGGTVGSGSLAGTKRWGGSATSAQHWTKHLATEGVVSGVMSTPDQDYLLNGLANYYGIVPL